MVSCLQHLINQCRKRQYRAREGRLQAGWSYSVPASQGQQSAAAGKRSIDQVAGHESSIEACAGGSVCRGAVNASREWLTLRDEAAGAKRDGAVAHFR